MLVRPMLLHRMALVSVRLFCKNLGNLQEFFWANGLLPSLAKNGPYAYEIVHGITVPFICAFLSIQYAKQNTVDHKGQ